MFSTCKLYDRSGGGLSITLKKNFSEKIKLPRMEEILVKYDEEKNQLIIGCVIC